jgi:hypothetical protein|tara:strand:- start:2958 stop:3125 length:168 start_codon:yes stop_codon:yes gene_type:complete
MKIIIISLILLVSGCQTMNNQECSSIHVGSIINDEGQFKVLKIEEMGCPRIDTFK